MSEIYIGIMSGTSADAIDTIAVNFENNQTRVLGSYSETLSTDVRTLIHQLATAGEDEINALGHLDIQLGELFAQCANHLLEQLDIDASQIAAIGSHGQTIRHAPPGTTQYPFTLQVGDPNVIAQRTSITTVADFRRRDMAVGGQGAPLVPAFHHAIFHSNSVNRIVVNIGGMANISWLPREGRTLGFDTGPGNVLMDGWIWNHQKLSFDESGAWADSGKINQNLLTTLLEHPFINQAAPKSTGREAFNSGWLRHILKQQPQEIKPEDVQASLLAFTAHSITNNIKKLLNEDSAEIYVCGGGAYNTSLMKTLQILNGNCLVATTASLGIAPELVESAAFAWLARQTLNKKPGNLPDVTGARTPVILGGVYYA